MVFLTKKYAIKIPNIRGWRRFLWGLLANMQEKQWSGFDDFLCPVLFCSWGGWLLIMPLVRIEENSELSESDFLSLVRIGNDDAFLPVENKRGHFGWLGKRLVAIDYGS